MAVRTVAPLLAGVAIATWILPLSVAHGRVLTPLNIIRMDGYVGPPPERRREVADLRLRAGQKEVRFQVTNARVVKGAITAAAVFRQVRPQRPNFTLSGPPELIAKVADAALGAQLRIIGAWRSGSRALSLSSVETQPAAESSPSADQPARPGSE